MLLILAEFFSVRLACAQSGPGGVGNSTGSNGQPLNKLWLKADAGITTAFQAETSVTVTAAFGNVSRSAGTNSLIATFPVGSTIRIGGTSATVTAGNATSLTITPTILQITAVNPSRLAVSIWVDQANTNNAVQPSSANQPMLVNNALNGNPVVRFDGLNRDMLFGATLDKSNALPLAFFAVTANTTNPKALFDSRPGQSDPFRFFNDGSGPGANNSIEFWNNNPAIGSVTLSNTGSVMSISGTLSGSSQRQLSVFVGGSQVGATATGNSAAVGFSSARLGSVNGSNPTPDAFFSGDMAEVVYFSEALNDAQRIIVENYLGAKYGIALTTNDRYASTTFIDNVIGIGTTNGTIKHITSGGGALHLTESGSSLNTTNEYLFAANNNTAHGTATTLLSGGVNSRWTREYRVEKTGTVDALVGFDFSEAGLVMPTGNPAEYVLLYRSTTGATNYSVVTGSASISGSQVSFNIANANLATGYYTLGVKYIPGTFYTYNANCNGSACDWSDPGSWTTDNTGAASVGGRSPRSGDNVVILNGGMVNVTTNNLSVNNVTINSGGTLDLGTTTGHTFATLNNTSPSGAGTLRLSASAGGTPVFPSIGTNNFFSATGNTIEYDGATSYNLPNTPSMYQNLIISGGGTKTAAGSITVNKNFTNQAATTFTTGSNLTFKGNFTNEGTVRQTNNVTTFSGTAAQIISGTSPVATNFNDVSINNSGAGAVSSTIDFMVNGDFSNDNNAAFSASAGTVTLGLNGAQSIGGTGSGTVNFYNLTAGGNNTKTIKRNFSVSNALYVDNNATLQYPTGASYAVSTNNVSVDGTFNIKNGGAANTHKLSISGNLTVSGTGTFDMDNGSRVCDVTFNGTNSAISGSGSITFNDVTFNAGLTATCTSNMAIVGNLINNGTLTASAGRTTFDSGSPQSISGSGTTTLFNLTVGSTNNNTDVTLSQNITVAGTANGTNGNGTDAALGIGTKGTVSAGSNTITFTGTGGTFVSNNANFTPGTGTVVFAGSTSISNTTTFKNIQINSGSSATTASSLTIGGNLVNNNGTFNQTSGTTTFNGTNQSIGGTGSPSTTFNNLTTSGGGTKTLTGNAIVNGNLTLTNGVIALSNYNLQLAAASTIVGTPTASNMVQASGTGVLRKLFNATGSFTFPVGTGNVYTPVTINLTAATFGGAAGSRYVDVRPVASVAPNQLDATYSLAKYWAVNSTNLSGINATLAFTYVASEANATIEPQYVPGYWNGSTWVTGTTSNIASRVINFTKTGIADLNGNWTAGPVQAFTVGNFYSIATGNYETAATWSLTGYAGTAAPFPPLNGSNIFIGNNKTVTTTTNGKTIATLQIDATGALNLGTNTGITITTFNTTNNTGTAGTLRLSAAAAGTAVFPTVSGTNNFLNTNGSIVEYTGSTSYTLPFSPNAYQHLVISGGGTKTLAGDVTVNGNLSLTSGVIALSNYNLQLAAASTIVGTPTASNMVKATGTGVLRKLFNATGSFTFPVGTGSVYTPVTINLTAATFAGAANSRYVDIRPVASAPAAQLDPIYSLNKHWMISTTNLTNFTCDLSFTYDISERSSVAEPSYISAYSLVSPATVSPTASWVTGTGTVTVASRTISHLGFTSSGGLTNSIWTALPPQAVIPTNFYSIANGDYEVASTWSTTAYAGTAAPLPPTIGSSVYVGNNKTVTMLSGSKAIATLQIDGGATPGTLDLGTNTGITITTFNTSTTAGTAGTLRLSAVTSGTAVFPTVSGTNNFLNTNGSVVEYNNTTTYSLPTTPSTYQNLVLSGNSVKTLLAGININGNLSITTGMLSFGNTGRTVGVSGNLSGAGSIIMTGSASHVLNLSGVSNSMGTLVTDTNNSTVNYTRNDGTAQQVFASVNYRNLTITGSGNKTVQGPTTVNTTLSVTGGTFAFGTLPQTVLVNGNLSGVGTLDMSGAVHTLTLMGASNDIGSFISDSNASTVVYGGTTQQVFDSPNYRNLTISGSGTKTLTGGAVTVNNNLALSAGTLEVASQNFTVTGTSSVTGTLSDNSSSGTNTFGKVTVNAGGSVSTGNNSPFIFRGGITNNGIFSKTGNGAVTFDTNNQVIDGSSPITLTGTGVVTVNGVTVDNQHAGLLIQNLTVNQNGKWANSYTGFPNTYTGFSSASLILGQFNSLSASNNAGTSLVSSSGNNLILNRATGGSAYAVRTTNFSTAASAMVVRFDMSVTSAGTANNAATLLIGNNLTDDATVNAATARLQVNLGSGSTDYTITHPDGTATTSATYNNTQTVTWVINTSGSTLNYTNPNQQGLNTLANGKADVWVGNTRFAAGLIVQTAAQVMNNFKVLMTGGSGTISLNNIRINPLGTVNTGTLASSFCITAFVGTTFDVPFTTPGTMTGNTHFNANNVYTVQLSNASGSFASPLNIGTITTSALSGTISATIPAFTATGTGYRIRVVSSEPISVAADNGSDLSISLNSIIPYASQSITTASAGTTLTASAGGVTSYQWGYYTVLGGPITDLVGKTSATYTPYGPDFPGAGTYSLVCRMTTSTSCGTVASNEVVLYVNCAPQINLVTNGDFTAGNTGFTNSYTYVTGPNSMYPEGTYTVGNNPYDVHNLFCNMTTEAMRSPGSGGNMLVGNAATSGSLPVWKQTIANVTKNTDYVLTFWASSLAGTESSLLFGIYVGCFRVGPDISVPFQTINCTWNKYSVQLNSGNATSLDLAIANISAAASGNDIAIDDIQFYACDQVSSPPFDVADSYTWRGITSDWFNLDNWGTACALPGCGDDVIIPLLGPGKAYPVINGNGATAGSVTVYNGAKMTVNAGYNLDVCGDFINNGSIINNNNSTITFKSSQNPQLVSGNLTGSNKFAHVVVNKTNPTDVLKFSNSADIGGNLTNTKGNLDANGKILKIAGNFTNSGPFTHNNATVEFNGTGNQQFTQTGTGQFYNLIVNNSTATSTLTFNSAVTTVTNQLSLTKGIVVTSGSNEISVTNVAANAVSGHSASSYVNGKLRRAVNGTQTYDFPVGTTTRYELIRMQITAPLGASVTSIVGSFNNSTPSAGTGLPAVDGGSTFYSMATGGFWDLSPNAAADASARYNLTLFPNGFTVSGVDQTFIKRHDASSAWTFDGSTFVDATTRSGLSSFSEIVPASGIAPLPVRLLGFEGKLKNGQVQLDWQTASEKNNAYFEIQRSSDGRAFETMGTVSGAGTTNERRIYQHLDKEPLPGLSYYRLKQFDFDNRFEYSKTIAIDNMLAGDVIQLLPNPVGKDADVHLKITTTDDIAYTVLIRDLQGKELSQQTKQLTKGLNDWVFNQSLSLSTGMYVIQVYPVNRTKEKTIRYFKLVVQ